MKMPSSACKEKTSPRYTLTNERLPQLPLSQKVSVMKSTSSKFFATLRTMLPVTVCVTLVLIMLGGVVAAVTMAGHFSRGIKENFTVEVLLDDSIPQRDLQALKSNLEKAPFARQVNYISKAQATNDLLADLGENPEELLGSSPVPAELEVFLHAPYACRDSINKHIVPVKEKNKYVRDVVCPIELIDSVDGFTRTASLVALAVAALLAFISFALIASTVRSGVHNRRHAIRTMRLTGATHRFIRRPFMARAWWTGLLSAGLAGGLLWYGLDTLAMMNEGSDFAFVTSDVMLYTLLTVGIAGPALTLFWTFISVSHCLRMSDDEIFLK